MWWWIAIAGLGAAAVGILLGERIAKRLHYDEYEPTDEGREILMESRNKLARSLTIQVIVLLGLQPDSDHIEYRQSSDKEASVIMELSNYIVQMQFRWWEKHVKIAVSYYVDAKNTYIRSVKRFRFQEDFIDFSKVSKFINKFKNQRIIVQNPPREVMSPREAFDAALEIADTEEMKDANYENLLLKCAVEFAKGLRSGDDDFNVSYVALLSYICHIMPDFKEEMMKKLNKDGE